MFTDVILEQRLEVGPQESGFGDEGADSMPAEGFALPACRFFSRVVKVKAFERTDPCNDEEAVPRPHTSEWLPNICNGEGSSLGANTGRFVLPWARWGSFIRGYGAVGSGYGAVGSAKGLVRNGLCQIPSQTRANPRTYQVPRRKEGTADNPKYYGKKHEEP